MKTGNYYCVTTKRFTMYCKHHSWLEATHKLYNQVIRFYYNLLLDLEEAGDGLSEQGSQKALRSLEVLTIIGRDKLPVLHPLPWKKIPLYFRRAAINEAITAGRGYVSRNAKRLANEPCTNGLLEIRTESFSCDVTFYKGMYRELSEDHVSLKVWNGNEWKWMNCRLGGNTLGTDIECLSPSMMLQGNVQFLNVPVRETVSDGRKAKERIAEGTRLCCIQFTNSDYFAVAVILDCQGKQLGVRFFGGGNSYAHSCRQKIEKIKLSEQSMGLGPDTGKETLQCYNHKYWRKLKNISDHAAHCISKEIVDYCVSQETGLIILPEYSKNYTRFVMSSSGKWSAIHLSLRIRKQLAYKAWRQGIVVLETQPWGCSQVCSICRAPVHKKGTQFICENGHRGNRYLNGARNLGIRCLRSFQRIDMEE